MTGEYRVRPLRPESIGTCDWGHCDETAIAERHTFRFGWLTVCAKHVLPDADDHEETL